jgi:hypothetical protein
MLPEEPSHRRGITVSTPRSLFEHLELRLLLSGDYRSIDGSGNNLMHPEWGTTGQPLRRVSPPQYGDGISSPAGASRPSAREISNFFFQHHPAEDIFNEEGMSAFVYAWGQFIDHDLDLTDNATSPAEPFNIPVPLGDESFDPDFTGTQVIRFNRSQHAAGTGTSTSNPRQQPNSVTAYIDGSMVYGSDATRAAALRTFQGGLLKTSDNGQQLPYNVNHLPNQTDGFSPPESFFLAGDVRSNENAELTSVHVLFMREHNRLATLLAKKHPTWNDEDLYQEARKLVIAELQQITYNEFLPSFLGESLPAYTGYKPNINAQVANEFSTAAFRFGHSILGDDVQFFDDNCDTTLPDLKLKETFFAPQLQLNGGTDGLLKYLAAVSSQEDDALMVNSIRNFLFGPPGAGGFDLGALDVQRGRDHGLADLNTVRASLGLPPYTDFTQINSNPPTYQTLQYAYGNVDNIDLFLGGMVEAHEPGHVLGPTFERIIADQFTRTRDGDRYWYQNYLTPDEMALVQNMTLTNVIKANSTITNLQPDSFHFDVYVSGRVFNDANANGKFDNDESGIPNRYVYLLDEDGAIVDWALTNEHGLYKINKIQVGAYTATTDVPRFWQSTTPAPDPMTATSDIAFPNTNFGQKLNIRPANPPIAMAGIGSAAKISAPVKLVDQILGNGGGTVV